MDWFERLTGFREGSYEATRAKLKVEGRQLHSLVNGKSYGVGEFELASLRRFAIARSPRSATSGRLKVSVVRATCGKCTRRPNTGALSSRSPPSSTRWKWPVRK